VAPCLSAGDALVFDYRTLHRGRANVSAETRPVLVMTFAKVKRMATAGREINNGAPSSARSRFRWRSRAILFVFL
jgi:ectoine hydroxylase-related dioxygenase (phytanoyl-CoA dioxygenase family)